MRLVVEQLESRDCAAVMYSTGGVVYLLDGTNRTIVPFEQGAAQVPLFLAEDSGRIWIGAGQGGGPRLQVRDSTSLAVVSDKFVGNPASRTGVSVAVFRPGVPAVDPNGPLQAVAHTVHPGNPIQIQAAINAIPPGPAGWLAGQGATVTVYGGVSGIGLLPEFAALRGQLTPAEGDGNRTWDTVEAAASGDGVWLREDVAAYTAHELGHTVDFNLSAAEHELWRQTWLSIDWATYPTHGAPVDYFRLNVQEAFAESFRLWATSDPLTPVTVSSHFAGLAGRLGW